MRKTKAALGLVASACISCSGETDEHAQVTSGLEKTTIANEIGDVGNGLQSRGATDARVEVTPGWKMAELAEQKRLLQAESDVPAPKISPSRTSRALELSDQAKDDALLSVVVELESPPMFDEGVEAFQTNIPLAEMIASRKAQLADDQKRVGRALTALGGKVESTFWIGGSAVVATMPAKRLRDILQIQGVTEIGIPEPSGSPAGLLAIGDARSTDAMRTQALIDNSWEGNINNRVDATRPMRIGVIEAANMINSHHVGFKDSPNRPNRVTDVQTCNAVQCNSGTPSFSPSHGTAVTAVAMGSITQGQDSNFPGSNTTDQIRRSGHAPEAEVIYYEMDGTHESIRRAVEKAVSDGVDIINMSFQYDACDPVPSRTTTNQAFRDARSAGVLLVAASGNGATSNTDACGITWPATRPEVLSVGGLLTTDDTVPYRETTLGFNTPNCNTILYGGMPITTTAGHNGTATVLGLLAPGFVDLTYADDPAAYGTFCGSSVAAPAVAGAAADLRDAFRDIGWPAANSAGGMYANMLLMGDGYDGNAVVGGVSVRSVQPTRFAGFGRTRMRAPSSSVMTGPWFWHSSTRNITQGNTTAITVNTSAAEPNGITEFKAVAVWFPSSLTSVPDVDMEVWDTCASGGPVSLITNTGFDYHTAIRLPGSSVSGRCLEVRLIGFSAPSTVSVSFAYMFHGGAI
jgi:subtilisin family serine protease